MIDHFLDNLGVRRRVIMEASDTEAIKGLVESGFGYSMLPEYAIKGSKRSLQMAADCRGTAWSGARPW